MIDGKRTFAGRRFLYRRLIALLALMIAGSAAGRAQNAEFDSRGFKIDFAQVKDSPPVAVVKKAMRRQLEIVEQVGLSRENLEFFKSVPIVMIPDSSGTPGVYNAEKNTVYLKGRDLAANRPILLHEMLHAYHYLKIANGAPKEQIRAFYMRGIAAYPDYEKEYFLSNAREFFAVTASIYLFGDIPRPPFNRAAMRRAQPQYYQYLETLFGKRD